MREQPAAHRLGDNLTGKQGYGEERSVNSGPQQGLEHPFMAVATRHAGSKEDEEVSQEKGD